MAIIKDDDIRATRLDAGELDGAILPPNLAKKYENDGGKKTLRRQDLRLPRGDPAHRQQGRGRHRHPPRARRRRRPQGDGRLDPGRRGQGGLRPGPDRQPLVHQGHRAHARPAEAKKILDDAGWKPGEDGIREKDGVKATFPLWYLSGDKLRQDHALAYASDAKKARHRGRGAGRHLGGHRAPHAQGRGPRGRRLPGRPRLRPVHAPQLLARRRRLQQHGATTTTPRSTRPSTTARKSGDHAERQAAYDTVQRELVKNPGYTFLTHIDHLYVVDKRLRRPHHPGRAARPRPRVRPLVERRGLAAEEVTSAHHPEAPLGADGPHDGTAGPVRRPGPARRHLRRLRDRRRVPLRPRQGVRGHGRAHRLAGEPRPAARQPRRRPAAGHPLVGLAHLGPRPATSGTPARCASPSPTSSANGSAGPCCSPPPRSCVAILLGTALGVLAARRPGGWLDRAVTSLAYTLEAAPPFWLGLLAVWLFALKLGVLPSGGLTDTASSTVTAGQVSSHLVLPAAVLAISQLPWFVLYVRQGVGDALGDDPVRGARARGLAERTVLLGPRPALRHAARAHADRLPGARTDHRGAPGGDRLQLARHRRGHRAGRHLRGLPAARRADRARHGRRCSSATSLADLLYGLADPRVGFDG